MKVEKDDIEETSVCLDSYNSDLNLVIDASKTSASPLTREGFAFMWAGARATYGVTKGKIVYEVKVVNHIDVSHLPEDEPSPHVVRVGFSAECTSMQLGEEPFSYGYGGTGKISTNCQFKDYGTTFVEGESILAILNMDGDQVQMGFGKNGKFLGWAYKVNKNELQGKALYPHILTKNCSFEVNFGQRDQPYGAIPDGFKDYKFIGCLNFDLRERGTKAPERREDCEMIMMCGLPGAGKSVWANEFSSKHPEKKYNVLGTNNIIDKMKVMGLPRKRNYHGRWEVLIQMSTKCLNKMFEIGSKLRRNYILDQTNVYPTAQRRKMKNFDGFIRKAVVIVPTNEEYNRRCDKRDREEGKNIPDHAVLEMKANFKLPEVNDIFREVIFIELQQPEAEKLVAVYNDEGRAAVGPPQKRFQSNDSRNQSFHSRNTKEFDNSKNQAYDIKPFSTSEHGGAFEGASFPQDEGRGGFGSGGAGYNNRGGRGGRGGFRGGRGGFDGGRGGSDNGRGGYGNNRGGYDSSRGGFDGRRGGFESGRGGYRGGRGGQESNRGGYDSSRGGYEGGRGGYEEVRGGYEGGRGGYEGGRGRYEGGRGGFDSGRGGYDDRRGGYDERRGGYDGGRGEYEGGRGGYESGRGGYQSGRGGYEGGRGGYEGGRGGYEGGRGGYEGGRGGYGSGREGFESGRGGYDSNRGGYGNNRGYGGNRSGFNNNREDSYGSGRGNFGDTADNSQGFQRKRGFEEMQDGSSGGYRGASQSGYGMGYESSGGNMSNTTRGYADKASFQSSYPGEVDKPSFASSYSSQAGYGEGKGAGTEISGAAYDRYDSRGASFGSATDSNIAGQYDTSKSGDYNKASTAYSSAVDSYNRQPSDFSTTDQSGYSDRQSSFSYRGSGQGGNQSKPSYNRGRAGSNRTGPSRWSAETDTTAATQPQDTYSSYDSSAKTTPSANVAPTFESYSSQNYGAYKKADADAYGYQGDGNSGTQQWSTTNQATTLQSQTYTATPQDQTQQWSQYYQQPQSQYYGQTGAVSTTPYGSSNFGTR